MSDHHPDPAVITAWAEGQLAGAVRTEAESHLAYCAACRQDATAVALEYRRTRRRRRLLVAAPLAAAAMVILAIAVDQPIRPASEVEILRPAGDPEREGIRRFMTHLPVDDARLSPGNLIFIWQTDGADALYRFTLADEAGLELWTTTTRDTTLTLPDAVALDGGTRYLWFVDVLLPDGQAATTGLRRFTLDP